MLIQIIYQISKAEDIIMRKDRSKRTVEAITVSLRFLQQSENFEFEKKVFFEAMAYGAEACCLAACFGFRELYAVEYSNVGRNLGYRRLTRIGNMAEIRTRFSMGRFQENFVIGSYIFHFNTSIFVNIAYLFICSRC
jgi:hypothetical protein